MNLSELSCFIGDTFSNDDKFKYFEGGGSLTETTANLPTQNLLKNIP